MCAGAQWLASTRAQPFQPHVVRQHRKQSDTMRACQECIGTGRHMQATREDTHLPAHALMCGGSAAGDDESGCAAHACCCFAESGDVEGGLAPERAETGEEV
jgi:hypothetical protein